MAKRILQLAVFLAAGITSSVCGGEPTPAIPEKPTLTKPAGDYRIAWLELNGKARVFLALRDGKPTQFWSLTRALPGFESIKESDNLLVDGLKGDASACEIMLRLTTRGGIFPRRLQLSLSGVAGPVTGSWTLLDGDKEAANGTLTGTVATEAELGKDYGVAPGQDWPSFFGTLAANSGPACAQPFVDDLAKAKPLWRSEARMFTGWGNGADARYRSVAALGRLCGGSSSPIAADGMVYLYTYVPSGDGQLDEAAKEMIAKYDYAPAKDEMTRWYSVRADVVVTAIDAVTGKTVWQSVWPLKQGNYQTHKWRGLNHTPSVAKGVLVVSDYSWGLHAFDAKTGELKWTRGGGGPVPRDQGAIGPLISGDVVVWCTSAGTYGLDLQTGKEIWKLPSAVGARRMVIDGKERVLLTGATLTLIDPVAGKALTSAPYPGGFMKKDKKDLGRGMQANLVCEGPYIVSFETNMQGDKGVGTIFAFKASDEKIEPAWRHEAALPMEDGHIGIVIAQGKVFTCFQGGGAFAIDLQTGKTFKHQPEMEAHSNPTFTASGKYLIWQPECQHGSQHIQLMDADTFMPLGGVWSPPHNDTTAYGDMPINNIVVDGRLIIRAMDGVYCYDLRAPR